MKQFRAALRWLLDVAGLNLAVAAHGALTVTVLVGSRALEIKFAPFSLMVAGLVFSQICLATAWATWSAKSFLTRFGQLAWQMAWLYLLLLILESFEERRHTTMLWCLAVTMLPFVLSAWLPAVIFRWFSWRLAPSTARPQTPTPESRNQFRLADVWRWSTLLCVLLAVMACFRNEVLGWDGLGYAIFMYIGLMASGPTGLTVSLLLWLALGERWTIPRGILAGLLAVTFAGVSLTAAYFAADSLANDGDTWVGIWIMSVAVSVVTLATATLLRLQGWRLTRKGHGKKAK